MKINEMREGKLHKLKYLRLILFVSNWFVYVVVVVIVLKINVSPRAKSMSNMSRM